MITLEYAYVRHMHTYTILQTYTRDILLVGLISEQPQLNQRKSQGTADSHEDLRAASIS